MTDPAVEPADLDARLEPVRFPHIESIRLKALGAIDRWPLWALGVVGFAIVGLMYGAYARIGHSYLALVVADPFHPPATLDGKPIGSGAGNMLSSPLGPLIAWTFHLRNIAL